MSQSFWTECSISGNGKEIIGTIWEACRNARNTCINEAASAIVYNSKNEVIAKVEPSGFTWVRYDYLYDYRQQRNFSCV